MPYAPQSVCFVMLLAALSALPALSIDVLLPALPEIAADLGASTRQVQLTVSAFLLGAALGQLAIGPLADRFGRRPVIIAGLAVYVLASLGALCSLTITPLTLFRFAQGAGVATGFVLTRAMVRDLFDSRAASGILSTVMIVVSTASLVAPILGAALLLAGGWRVVFTFLTIAGVALLCFVSLRLIESIPERDRHALELRRISGNYRRFFGTRICASYALVNACLYGGLIAYLSGSPFVLVTGVAQLSETVFGCVLAVTAFALAVGAAGSGYLVKRHAPQRLVALGIACVAAASLALLLIGWLGPNAALPAALGLVLPMALFAFGVGLVAPNSTAIGMAPVSDMAGAASSVMLSLQAAVGAGTGYLVSLGQDGTPTSTAVVVAGCGMAAVLFYRLAECGGEVQRSRELAFDHA